ncbi:hypothetical protein QQ045_028862 [Rhodiola kirilowii]
MVTQHENEGKASDCFHCISGCKIWPNYWGFQLASKYSEPEDFNRPGHICPLKYSFLELNEQILGELGLRTMILMTNNPAKYIGLKGHQSSSDWHSSATKSYHNREQEISGNKACQNGSPPRHGLGHSSG